MHLGKFLITKNTFMAQNSEGTVGPTQQCNMPLLCLCSLLAATSQFSVSIAWPENAIDLLRNANNMRNATCVDTLFILILCLWSIMKDVKSIITM